MTSLSTCKCIAGKKRWPDKLTEDFIYDVNCVQNSFISNLMKFSYPPELQITREFAWLDIFLLPPLLWRSEDYVLR